MQVKGSVCERSEDLHVYSYVPEVSRLPARKFRIAGGILGEAVMREGAEIFSWQEERALHGCALEPSV